MKLKREETDCKLTAKRVNGMHTFKRRSISSHVQNSVLSSNLLFTTPSPLPRPISDDMEETA